MPRYFSHPTVSHLLFLQLNSISLHLSSPISSLFISFFICFLFILLKSLPLSYISSLPLSLSHSIPLSFSLYSFILHFSSSFLSFPMPHSLCHSSFLPHFASIHFSLSLSLPLSFSLSLSPAFQPRYLFVFLRKNFVNRILNQKCFFFSLESFFDLGPISWVKS